MSKRPKYHYILDKSIQCALSAIEIYNKPDFKYREETFVILMTNSWELLFKAKILKNNKNNLHSIYQVDTSQSLTKKGKPRKRPIYKPNRCGNYNTIDIFKAIEKIIRQEKNDVIDRILRDNIEVLVEIRDNAIHFINDCPILNKKVLEVGTATLRSYLTMVKAWFNYDLSKYNFFLMPLSFYHSFEIESFSINSEKSQIKNLLKYIGHKEVVSPSDENKPHNISLLLETKFIKSNAVEAFNVRYSNDGDISVKVDSEQVFANKYPLQFGDLISLLQERYVDFKRDKKFWEAKRNLEKDSKYCGERFLDIKKNKGAMKKYYNSEVVKEFDNHYKRKKLTLFD